MKITSTLSIFVCGKDCQLRACCSGLGGFEVKLRGSGPGPRLCWVAVTGL